MSLISCMDMYKTSIITKSISVQKTDRVFANSIINNSIELHCKTS